MSLRRRVFFGSGLGLAVAVLIALVLPLTAYGLTATVNLTGGALSFVTPPPDVNFGNVAISGSNQTVSANQPLDVRDATGSGAGWNLTANGTTFTTGTATLPNNAVTIASATPPSAACDLGSACTLPNNAVGYPYTLPLAAVPPSATKFYNANTNSGVGQMTVTVPWNLTVPGSATIGTYTSTWTITLGSGP